MGRTANSPFFMRAKETFERLLTYEFSTVLDVGSGDGVYTDAFRDMGKKVTSISLREPADVVGDYLYADLGTFDCLWVCHVLEHQRNVGSFLEKCYFDLNDNGILAITVPPLKHEIVGGHLSLWNIGLLVYNLILAGFDCSKAEILKYGYHRSVIVRKKRAELPELNMDFGDIEKLAQFFPFPAYQGFNGDLC